MSDRIERAPDRPSVERTWSAFLHRGPLTALAVGVSLSVAGFLFVRARERAVQQENLEEIAASRAVAVHQELETVTGQIRTTAVYLGTTHALEQGDYARFRPEFRRYAAELVQATPQLIGVLAVPRLAPDERADFLARSQPVGEAPFGLRERVADGTLAPAAERDVYYPIAIAAPLAPAPLRGVDLASDPDLRDRLEGSIRAGSILVAPVDRALPPGPAAAGIGMFVPIPARPDQPGLRPGFAVGLLDLPLLLQHALAVLPDAAVDVHLEDPITGAVVRPRNARPDAAGAASDSAWTRALPIVIDHNAWRVVTRARPEFLTPDQPFAGWLMLVAGVLFSFLVAAYLAEIRRRERSLAALAQERRDVADQLQAIFTSSLDAIISADDHGVVSEWNPSAERLFGWTEDEVRGKTLEETVIPPDDRLGHRAALEVLRRTGESPLIGTAFEYVMYRRDGGLLPVELVMTPTPIGKRVRITAFIRDISLRKQAEAAMKRAHDELERRVHERTAELEEAGVRIAESEQRLRMLIENAGDAVFLADGDGRLIDANRRACQMLGYERDELLRLKISDIETTLDQANPIRPSVAEMSVGEVITLQGIERRKDGTTFPVEIRAGPIEAGGERFYLALVRDVTERRAMEVAIEEARDRAIEASRLKSDFLANMSHEIRTPLNGILGMTGLLLDSELTPSQRDDLQTVRQSGEHLLALINDILDLARIEAGRFHLDHVAFDLEEVLHGVAALLSAAAEQKGIEFILRVAPNTPRTVVGDPARLRQVLVNLAGNAVKFTDRGHVLIEAEATRVEGGGAEVRFAVSDTGIGIGAEDLDRVFEKFTQADTSTRRRHGGAGLGLAISRQIVEAMGGALGAKSMLGRGSTFSFALTLELGESPKRKVWPSELAGVRALIVDDNPVNRRVLKEQATSWRMRATAVASPEEALIELGAAARDADAYRIALLDYQMDEMDGLELARRIRDRPELEHPTVILLSSVGRHFESSVVSAAGISRWLTKPVSPSELLDAVSQAWERSEAAVEPAAGAAAAENPSIPVLLAEDSPVNQKVAVRLLTKLGCVVDVAGNGVEAVEKSGARDYAVIFMDCQMPEMDGYEATRRIREREGDGRHHVPIIALTAHAMTGDRERCLAAGMDDYLSKPVPREGIEAMLKRYARPSARGDGDGSAPAAPRPPSAPAATSRFDLGALFRAVDRDAGMIEELAKIFRGQSGPQLEGLKAAVEKRDAEQVRRLGHALKGACATLYAGEAAGLAHEVEEAGKSGNPERARRVLPKLEEHVRAIPDDLLEVARTLVAAEAE